MSKITVLVGAMPCGKTTLARKISAETGAAHMEGVDLYEIALAVQRGDAVVTTNVVTPVEMRHLRSMGSVTVTNMG